jgi:membrane fusion protein, multidrug efflux system
MSLAGMRVAQIGSRASAALAAMLCASFVSAGSLPTATTNSTAKVTDQQANLAPAPEAARLFSDFNGVSDGSSVRAIVRSVRNVTIGSELNARIKEMPFRDGDTFVAGDVLVQFDCARTLAELAAAVATYNGRKTAYESSLRLLSYKAIGSLNVDQAKFETDKAAADVQNLEVKRDSCTIVAPFRGRIVEKLAQAHEVAQANQPMMKIVEDGTQEFVLMVPSSWLSKINLGSKFSIRIDETGETHAATVTQVGGSIDPISQSIRMIAEVSAANLSLSPGMSGTALFDLSGSRR